MLSDDMLGKELASLELLFADKALPHFLLLLLRDILPLPDIFLDLFPK